jgi:hypothetical protein
MTNAERERLIDRILASPAMRTVVEVIVDQTVQYERDRLVAYLQTGGQLPLPTMAAPQRIRRQTSGYGAVAGPVRDALKELSNDAPDGVGASDIAAYFVSVGGGPNVVQVRAALKQLRTRGDAVRGERGKYLSREATASPPASDEIPDAGASGQFAMAYKQEAAE